MLDKLGGGSFERAGTILGLDRRDDKSVNDAMRVLVAKSLDRAALSAPAVTVEFVVFMLAARLMSVFEQHAALDAEAKRLKEAEAKDPAFYAAMKALAGEKG
jgi:hypothetical protein